MEQFLKVHSVESFGTNDGPGIRLVIFLQGCNIRCKYCQNADTIPLGGGELFSINDLLKKAFNMKSYFGTRGGVTVSGGEPLLQSKVLIPFFNALKREKIHTNIDTNGTIVTPDAKQLISELSDLVMFDIKNATPEGFKDLVSKNLFKQSEQMIALRENSQKPFWFRYVLIPGITDSPDHLHTIGEKYSNFKQIERFQILPYHKLGQYKWEMLGEKYQLTDTPENTPEQIETAKNILKNYFENVV